jgi:predicted transcriptional regulator
VTKSRIEVVALILQAAIEGVTAKRMLNKVFPSLMLLEEYLVVLQENCLLDYRLDEQIYITTSKGINFLRIYSELNEAVVMTGGNENTRHFHVTFLMRTRSIRYLTYYLQYISNTLRSLLQKSP